MNTEVKVFIFEQEDFLSMINPEFQFALVLFNSIGLFQKKYKHGIFRGTKEIACEGTEISGGIGF